MFSLVHGLLEYAFRKVSTLINPLPRAHDWPPSTARSSVSPRLFRRIVTRELSVIAFSQPPAPRERLPPLSSQAEFRVLVIGVERCGKTSLLEKLKSLYTDTVGLPSKQIVPTVGLNIAKLVACDSKLTIWDLGGQKGLRSIWEKYYAEAHAIVFVIDAREDSQDSRDTLQRLLTVTELDGAPVLVMMNKSDLVGGTEGTDSIRKEYEGLLSQSSRKSKVLSACAHSGEGLR